VSGFISETAGAADRAARAVRYCRETVAALVAQHPHLSDAMSDFASTYSAALALDVLEDMARDFAAVADMDDELDERERRAMAERDREAAEFRRDMADERADAAAHARMECEAGL
jgi:hypothetical protein